MQKSSASYRTGWGIALLAVGALMSFPAEARSQDLQATRVSLERPTEVTFTKDVAKLLQENCQVCHQAGGIGPMPLMTFEQVKAFAPLIRQRVLAREMPPYHYDTDVGIQQLKYDARLSDEEISTIVAWVALLRAASGDLARTG